MIIKENFVIASVRSFPTSVDWPMVCARSEGMPIFDYRCTGPSDNGCKGVLGIGINLRRVGDEIVCDVESVRDDNLSGVVSCEWHPPDQTIISVALVAYPLTPPPDLRVGYSRGPRVVDDCDEPAVVTGKPG